MGLDPPQLLFAVDRMMGIYAKTSILYRIKCINILNILIHQKVMGII